MPPFFCPPPFPCRIIKTSPTTTLENTINATSKFPYNKSSQRPQPPLDPKELSCNGSKPGQAKKRTERRWRTTTNGSRRSDCVPGRRSVAMTAMVRARRRQSETPGGDNRRRPLETMVRREWRCRRRSGRGQKATRRATRGVNRGESDGDRGSRSRRGLVSWCEDIGLVWTKRHILVGSRCQVEISPCSEDMGSRVDL